MWFSVAYLVFSIAILWWTTKLLSWSGLPLRALTVTRVMGVFADIGAAALYTAMSGGSGVILYPVFLTICIGYGYRFGVQYLYFAVAVSVIAFSVAAAFNPHIAGNTPLLVAYYLGMALVPIYSASLLNRHTRMIEQVREVNAARARFIANMSHELRTPLHAILSGSELLSESSLIRSNTEAGGKVRLITDSASHLLSLVNKVLDIAAADASGKTSISTSTISLYSTLISSLEICAPNAEGKQLDLHWNLDLKLPPFVESSPDHIREILINTIGNAIKYTNSGSVCVSFKYFEHFEDLILNIVIEDTGIGISEALLPTIFEPFTLGDDRASRKHGGTGLGLAITKQFVEYLGGSIHFSPREEGGTVCEVNLPLVATADPTSAGILVNPIDCIVVSDNPLSSQDSSKLEAANFVPNRISWPEWRRESNLRESVVFMDVTGVAEVDNAIGDRTLLKRPSLAVAYFHRGRQPSESVRSQFNAVIDLSSESELKALRHLASYLTSDDSIGTISANALSLEGLCILVADDNPINLETARLSFEASKAEVTLVESGEEALDLLETGTYDVAFIDLHMPNMSGIEVCQMYQYLVSDAPTPIVILTADITTAAHKEAEKAGAVAVLTKPLRVAEFRSAVTNYSRRACRNRNTHKAPEHSLCTNGDCLVDAAVLEEFVELGVAKTELEAMISEFFEDARNQISAVHQLYPKGNINDARNTLHSLKGSAGVVGATVLSNRVTELYDNLDALGTDKFAREIETLAILLDHTEEELAKVIAIK